MFVRYWAQTNTSTAAKLALDYCQAIVRFARVRLISLTGQLEGRWQVMAPLLATPMVDPMINVVCAEQEHWSTTIEVGMPESDTLRATLASGKEVPTKVERVKHERELYTAGVRNVLIAVAPPTLPRYCRAAEKYEHVVVPTPEVQRNWFWPTMPQTQADPAWRPTCIPVPITDFRALRTAVLGS